MAQLKLGNMCVHSPSSGNVKNMDPFSKTFLKVSMTLSIPTQLIRAPVTSARAVSSEHIISRQIVSHWLPPIGILVQDWKTWKQTLLQITTVERAMNKFPWAVSSSGQKTRQGVAEGPLLWFLLQGRATRAGGHLCSSAKWEALY